MRTVPTSPLVATRRQALGTLHWLAAIVSGVVLLSQTSGVLPPSTYRGRGAGSGPALSAAFAMWPYLVSWRASRNRIPISRVRMLIFIVALAAATVTAMALIENAMDGSHPLTELLGVTIGEALLLVLVSSLFRLPEV
jgi:hypothetical protein